MYNPTEHGILQFFQEVSQVDKYIAKNMDSNGRFLIIYSHFFYPKGLSCQGFYGETEKPSRNASAEEFLLAVSLLVSIKVNILAYIHLSQ